MFLSLALVVIDFDKKGKIWMKKPLIIIPAYNVEKEINKLLDNLQEYRDRLVVINDGSEDSTLNIIRKKGFKVLNNNINKGISFSVNKGIEWAKREEYDKIILMDSDGQHDPQFIPQFEEALDYYDFVYGNRFGKSIYLPSTKIASNMMAALLVKSIWKKNISDVACGFKAFCLNKGIESTIDVTGNYSIVYDILFYSLRNQLKIKRIDISAIYYPNELWYTRIDELIALLSSIERFTAGSECNNLNINNLKDKIYNKKDFKIEVMGHVFFAFYLNDKNGYVFQSDIRKLYDYANGDL